MKRSTNDYRSAPKSIKLSDVNDSDLAVITVTRVTDVTIDGKRKMAIHTQEFGDGRVYYPNLESIDRLISALGDDDARWIGQRIPLVKTDSEFDGKPVQSLWIAPAEQWSDLLGTASKKSRR